jgi:murein DD-endopeptidase MepM/ murein hydrolase activator NlpD
MGKKFTFLLIPDDDSETTSYTFSKFFLNFLIGSSIFLVIFSIFVVLTYVPKISLYENINQKYNRLAKERMKVLEIAKNLEKLIQMDEFVRNSLGAEFNFSENPEVSDSILMIIPDNNLISLSDNIPSLAPIEGFVSKRMESVFSSFDKTHVGIDIIAKEGTPIKSATSGVVVFSGWTYEMGNLIIIYHGDDYMTHYGHNQQNLVSRLDAVKKGQVIGFVGNTGISSGPHLHFEVWKGEKSIDPLVYFPEYLKKDLTLKK